MSDVEEIIDFIRQLKRGFDKELFQSKIDELAYIAETRGLESDDFHTLFKLWLNLSITITKWISLGVCLVPESIVEERTVDYAFRWLLINYENQNNISRVGFLLDWLTAAMNTDNIDMTALDSGYEIFCEMLSYEALTVYALKLVYTLTKPSDVTRKRVRELMEIAKKRDGKKNMLRQIQVLLGLFKSYRPECVPEEVPAVSIHTSFRKINTVLMARFKKCQERRNITTKGKQYLSWINPLNCGGGKKKAYPLVPNMEFANIGSTQYADKEAQKTHFDFSDPASLLRRAASAGTQRPARLRALLCNSAGLALLCLTPDHHAFFSHDLHHLLNNCFLDSSPHSYAEKADLLERLAALQRVLLQGIPVVTRFLAQYLPFWNERDYFPEIMGLLEWVSVDSADQLSYLVESLTKIYYRAQPLEQCVILRTVTTMYCNMVFSSTRKHQHFLSSQPQWNLAHLLPLLASLISDMCHKGLQINPDDMRVGYTSVQCAERSARAEAGAGAGAGAVPGPLTLALPLLTNSALLHDKMAALLMLYRKIFSQMKATNRNKEQTYVQHRKTLEGYTSDFLNCLYHEQALDDRKSGLVFQNMHPQLVAKLCDLVPEADGKFSIKNGLPFIPYTLELLQVINPSDVSNKLCIDAVIQRFFPNLGQFLDKAVRRSSVVIM